MKTKFVFLIFVCFVELVSAQGVYTKKIVYNRFDEELSNQDVRTLIKSTLKFMGDLSIETKGDPVQRYKIVSNPVRTGSQESPVNLCE